jgi:hypothetical protein
LRLKQDLDRVEWIVEELAREAADGSCYKVLPSFCHCLQLLSTLMTIGMSVDWKCEQCKSKQRRQSMISNATWRFGTIHK